MSKPNFLNSIHCQAEMDVCVLSGELCMHVYVGVHVWWLLRLACSYYYRLLLIMGRS